MDKRSGRQSAQAAKQTKQQILAAAATLFCQKGFDKVSVREISEAAGVSHGLLRYHFGSKEQIWQRICDQTHDQIQQLMVIVVEQADPDLQPNQRLFIMLYRLMASLLLDPRPSRLAASAMGSKQELFDYLYDNTGKADRVFAIELARTQEAGYLTTNSIYEIKWLCCLFCDAPVTLEPLLLNTYRQDKDQALLAHWRLFTQLIAPQLGITADFIPTPCALSELAIPFDHLGQCADHKVNNSTV